MAESQHIKGFRGFSTQNKMINNQKNLMKGKKFRNLLGLSLICLCSPLWAQNDLVSSYPQHEASKSAPSTPSQDDESDKKTPKTQAIEAVCGDEAESESWLDRSYSYLNEQLCAPAVWFDGFFGDPRSLEENPINSFIRVRSALGWDETKGTSGGVQVRANLVLPRLSERVRLLISRDEDVSGDGLSGLGVDDAEERTRLGLRLILGEGIRGFTDLDATVRVESGSLNPQLASRYRVIHPLGDRGLFRGTQTAFWERLDGFGTQSRIDLEWAPRPERLVRWTSRGTFSEASEGVDWNSVLIAYQQLDRRTALRADVGAFGFTRPSFETEEWFVSVRLRRQFLRPWLFVEFQPERAWPLDRTTLKRRGDWRATMTFEIQFENQPPSHRRRWDIER